MALKQIDLTPPERLFRKCLLDCRDATTDVSGMKNLEIRWTGGWVRDKLLGTTSHDIDVALSTMTGEKFGLALQSYMRDNAQKYEDEAQKQGFKAEIKNLHKIAANPDKSKHLETITTRMFGIDIDFVNLRKEVYDEQSRNPQIEFGTPEEDALRRDACCNALFYNLDTQQVEDFTKRGLDDMKNKIIRTPLAPYQTFKDDPLRVLRLIRFAARLGYTIQDDALEAMADPTIHDALRLKITRERVGVEVGKIMTGPDPYSGLTRIYDRNLYATVFADPRSTSQKFHEESFPVALNTLCNVLDRYSSICLVLKPKDDINLAWSLAAYVPYRDDEDTAVTAVREGIKATNVVVKVLGEAIRFRARLRVIVEKIAKADATRAEVGVALKDAGKSWRYHILYSLMCDAVDEQFTEVADRYTTFVKYVQEQKLEGAAELKPIINGNDIKKALDIQKAGSWLKSALEFVTEWQFANPQGTADEAKEMIKHRRDQIQGLET
ncbi:CCA tRNA nucleotidyltransferase, mitochondrial [Neophaeococcomyces mojaviensis]|uniref:CCA tRNA nucleotidyltransferase, mitochondrial n=1 Tax=Neophaeococcomyces mojaviensis TaxID=3383035 RepID=A0ACC3A2H6_9EURO|nr:CCA tRNA nucleotidyltransferase, mitochondrial [Knufia sp. JES_112]